MGDDAIHPVLLKKGLDTRDYSYVPDDRMTFGHHVRWRVQEGDVFPPAGRVKQNKCHNFFWLPEPPPDYTTASSSKVTEQARSLLCESDKAKSFGIKILHR